MTPGGVVEQVPSQAGPKSGPAVPEIRKNPVLDFLLRLGAGLLCKLFHDIRVEGRNYLPRSGPVILAANHPSYFDPVYLILRLKRPVRFLAWEKPFQIPVLGALIKRYGTIPLNTQKPGRASFEAAVRCLQNGEVFGIFPEGGRSVFGTMNPLKSGVARLAMMTGAPILPATVMGAYWVWPKHNLLPRPGPVTVRFHPPIHLSEKELKERRRDRRYEQEIVEKVLGVINRSLLPSIKAEKKEERLINGKRIPWRWGVEGAVLLALTAYDFPRSFNLALLFLSYFLLDRFLLPQGRMVKLIRHLVPWAFLAALCAESLGPWTWLFLPVLGWFVWFRFRPFRNFQRWALPLAYLLLIVSAAL